jgi:DNA-binding GntR family transcriptional regulator
MTSETAPHDRRVLRESAVHAPPKLLSQSIADWLATAIIDGQYAPGERLHEVRIADKVGASRSPVREALRVLAREGLVEIVPRIGAQVALLGSKDACDLWESRILIEPECVRSAVRVMKPDDIAGLKALRSRMEAAARERDAAAFLDNNIAYNRHLISCCENATLRELVEYTWNKAVRYWNLLVRIPGYIEPSLRRHRVLHRAVVSGDAEAAAAAQREMLVRALHELRAAVVG